MLKTKIFITKCFYGLVISTPLLATQDKLPTTTPIALSVKDEVFDLLNIQNEIFNILKSNEQKLISIQKSNGTLIEKWQQLLHVILPIQLEVIKTYDFGDTQSGLSKFNEEYSHRSTEYASLLELNKQKWLFLFEKTFGITEFREISLQEAQSVIADIVEEVTSESFLKQIDNLIITLGKDASLMEKRKALLTILFPLHMSVMAKHGFEGEMGYIQAQRAIMDYYYDPLIAQGAAHARTVIFRRAQLIQ